MAENNEEEHRQVIRITKDGSQEDKKKQIKDQLYERMKETLIEKARDQGIEIQNPDSMTVEEMNNYSQMLKKLKDEGLSKVRSSPPEGGDTPRWRDAEEINRSRRTYSNDREYNSQEDLIRDLRQKSRSANGVEAAEADAILTELWKKWGKAYRDSFKDDATQKAPKIFYEPKDENEVKKKITRIQKEGA